MSTYEVSIGDCVRLISIVRLEEQTLTGLSRYTITIDDADPVVVESCRPVPDVLSLLMDGRTFEAGLVPHDDGFEVEVLGLRYEAGVVDPRRKALRLADGAKGSSIETKMPGRIVSILVAEGDSVERGQAVMIVEAMKMENQMKAPADAVVKKICVSPGELVEARTTLIELEPT